MKLLAFELATEACSVALFQDGAVLARHAPAPRQHAALALPWADALLAEAGLSRRQIDAVAVGRGPGAFTGVRLALSIAQGIALGLDRPVVPVSTLAALAQPGLGNAAVLACIDARMGELYWGLFAADGEGVPIPVSPEALVGQADMVECLRPWLECPVVAMGSGLQAGTWAEALADRWLSCDPAALPTAAAVARIAAREFARGGGMPADRIEPTYLRDKVALTSIEQQALRASRA